MIKEIDFIKSLDEVIEKKDKVIVIYSGLWTFIDKLNFIYKHKNQIPNLILQIIEKKVGKKRLLLLPSFSGKEIQKKKFFDINKTIDKENGIIPLTAIKKGYYRIPLPIHSYLAYGNIKMLKNIKFKSSWGKLSILEFLSKKNARICNLGLPWNEGCAYLHRFEELYKVPWRYHKTFKVKFKKKGKINSFCYETKFCSPREISLNYDFHPFIKKIENSQSFRKSENKSFKFESIKTDCLDKIGKDYFRKNPWVIIKNIREVKNWIQNKKKYSLSNI